MNALETMENILNQPNLINANLRYCLIDKNKVPFKIDGTKVQPNNINDFVDFHSLCIDNLADYAGIGISIQASNICAIDVDHCFSIPFDDKSGDDRAKDIIRLFKNFAYCEFSFSGTGLRILFRHSIIENYKKIYYIKNSKFEIEYYQPSESYRYVTLTGKNIVDNALNECPDSILFEFLEKYMLRPRKLDNGSILSPVVENRTIEQLTELVKHHYLTNMYFQDAWFSNAPGSGKDESERDFYLLHYLFINVTQDKEMIKTLFESSPFFKSKDWKHKNKWEYNDYRYYNYIYDQFGG